MKNILFAIIMAPLTLLALVDDHIKVDQFGYLPYEVKVAVIREAQSGQFSPDDFTCGDTLIVRKSNGGAEVFRGPTTVWKNGATDDLSGDKGWWFDFSNVTDPGTYEIYDSLNDAVSPEFQIGADVYSSVLTDAVRTFYYQRCGISKESPYAESPWTDGACHLQDTATPYAFDSTNESLVKDLSGGWHDAGDYNKYITFLPNVINPLLQAYQSNPTLWKDDTNIPESNNGIPDILDEINYELQWAYKMQDDDGKVFLKMGTTDYSGGTPPTSHTAKRYYGRKSSASTITFAAFMAHAAYVFQDISELSDDAVNYQTAAIKAWDVFDTSALDTAKDLGEVKSGDADLSIASQKQQAMIASMWLFALTGDTKYHDYFKANISVSNWGPYNPAISQALLYYTTLNNADASISSEIKNELISNGGINSKFYTFVDSLHLYRSYMPAAQYHWGSLKTQSTMGIQNYLYVEYNLNNSYRNSYLEKAFGALHYIHGVNPMGKVYLTNMNDRGAENSVDELYHSWFSDGSQWDNVNDSYGPAPAILVGGPNRGYTGTTSPPANQPPEKSYVDFNDKDWQYAKSWEITENSITYQAAYVNLLSLLVSHEQITAIDDKFISKANFRLNFNAYVRNGKLLIDGIKSKNSIIINLFDVKGRVICSVKSNVLKNTISIKLPQIAAGTYFLEIKSLNDIFKKGKVVVQ